MLQYASLELFFGAVGLQLFGVLFNYKSRSYKAKFVCESVFYVEPDAAPKPGSCLCRKRQDNEDDCCTVVPSSVLEVLSLEAKQHP